MHRRLAFVVAVVALAVGASGLRTVGCPTDGQFGDGCDVLCPDGTSDAICFAPATTSSPTTTFDYSGATANYVQKSWFFGESGDIATVRNTSATSFGIDTTQGIRLDISILYPCYSWDAEYAVAGDGSELVIISALTFSNSARIIINACDLLMGTCTSTTAGTWIGSSSTTPGGGNYLVLTSSVFEQTLYVAVRGRTSYFAGFGYSCSEVYLLRTHSLATSTIGAAVSTYGRSYTCNIDFMIRGSLAMTVYSATLDVVTATVQFPTPVPSYAFGTTTSLPQLLVTVHPAATEIGPFVFPASVLPGCVSYDPFRVYVDASNSGVQNTEPLEVVSRIHCIDGNSAVRHTVVLSVVKLSSSPYDIVHTMLEQRVLSGGASCLGAPSIAALDPPGAFVVAWESSGNTDGTIQTYESGCHVQRKTFLSYSGTGSQGIPSSPHIVSASAGSMYLSYLSMAQDTTYRVPYITATQTGTSSACTCATAGFTYTNFVCSVALCSTPSLVSANAQATLSSNGTYTFWFTTSYAESVSVVVLGGTGPSNNDYAQSFSGLDSSSASQLIVVGNVASPADHSPRTLQIRMSYCSGNVDASLTLTFQCDPITTCSSYGTCNTTTVTCTCDSHHAGSYCDHCVENYWPAPTCENACSCSGHGTCDQSGTCTCFTGFTGDRCDSCAYGYYGSNCETYCLDSITCNGLGTCSTTGTCTCNPNYFGASCDAYCEASATCNGHGSCGSSGACICDAAFAGLACQTCSSNRYNYPTCTYCEASTTCNGHGTCIYDGTCGCSAAFAGQACDECAVNYYNYPACDTYCEASTTCSGHGMCSTTGSCECNPGFDINPDCSLPEGCDGPLAVFASKVAISLASPLVGTANELTITVSAGYSVTDLFLETVYPFETSDPAIVYPFIDSEALPITTSDPIAVLFSSCRLVAGLPAKLTATICQACTGICRTVTFSQPTYEVAETLYQTTVVSLNGHTEPSPILYYGTHGEPLELTFLLDEPIVNEVVYTTAGLLGVVNSTYSVEYALGADPITVVGAVVRPRPVPPLYQQTVTVTLQTTTLSTTGPVTLPFFVFHVYGEFLPTPDACALRSGPTYYVTLQPLACVENTCSGHGTCEGDAICTCSIGFTGERCDQCAAGYTGYPDCQLSGPCAGTPCNGHGVCTETPLGGYTCACNSYFAGETCSACDIDALSLYPDCDTCAAPSTSDGLLTYLYEDTTMAAQNAYVEMTIADGFFLQSYTITQDSATVIPQLLDATTQSPWGTFSVCSLTDGLAHRVLTVCQRCAPTTCFTFESTPTILVTLVAPRFTGVYHLASDGYVDRADPLRYNGTGDFSFAAGMRADYYQELPGRRDPTKYDYAMPLPVITISGDTFEVVYYNDTIGLGCPTTDVVASACDFTKDMTIPGSALTSLPKNFMMRATGLARHTYACSPTITFERQFTIVGSACTPDSCNGHGTCTDVGGLAVCQCTATYAGTFCERCADGYSVYPDCLPSCTPLENWPVVINEQSPLWGSQASFELTIPVGFSVQSYRYYQDTAGGIIEIFPDISGLGHDFFSSTFSTCAFLADYPVHRELVVCRTDCVERTCGFFNTTLNYVSYISQMSLISDYVQYESPALADPQAISSVYYVLASEPLVVSITFTDVYTANIELPSNNYQITIYSGFPEDNVILYGPASATPSIKPQGGLVAVASIQAAWLTPGQVTRLTVILERVYGMPSYDCDDTQPLEVAFLLYASATLECITSNPCLNGGECVDSGTPVDGQVVCVCPEGWSGPLCGSSTDPCASHPCYQGTCEAIGGSFVCHCPRCFSGQVCSDPDTLAPVAQYIQPAANRLPVAGPAVPIVVQTEPSVYVNLSLTSTRYSPARTFLLSAGGQADVNGFFAASVNVTGIRDGAATLTAQYCDDCGNCGSLDITVLVNNFDGCAALECLNGGVCEEDDAGVAACVCDSAWTGASCECPVLDTLAPVVGVPWAPSPWNTEDTSASVTATVTDDSGFLASVTLIVERTDVPEPLEMHVMAPLSSTLWSAQWQPGAAPAVYHLRVVAQDLCGRSTVSSPDRIVQTVSGDCQIPGRCLNGGTCTELAGNTSYSCTCACDYTGSRCQTYSPVPPPACVHGTLSRDAQSCAYTCTCDSGWTGMDCSQASSCASTNCGVYGSCNPSTGSCVCVDPRYNPAANCQACSANYYNYPTCTYCAAATTCSGHGSCSTTGQCVCDSGWTGTDCSQNIDECLAVELATGRPACEHGGVCVDQVAGFSCMCKRPWKGPRCETRVRAQVCKSPNPCANNGQCHLCYDPAEGIPDSFTGDDSDQATDDRLFETPARNRPYECPWVNSTSSLDHACRCRSGYVGVHCERRAHDCDSAEPCCAAPFVCEDHDRGRNNRWSCIYDPTAPVAANSPGMLASSMPSWTNKPIVQGHKTMSVELSSFWQRMVDASIAGSGTISLIQSVAVSGPTSTSILAWCSTGAWQYAELRSFTGAQAAGTAALPDACQWQIRFGFLSEPGQKDPILVLQLLQDVSGYLTGSPSDSMQRILTWQRWASWQIVVPGASTLATAATTTPAGSTLFELMPITRQSTGVNLLSSQPNGALQPLANLGQVSKWSAEMQRRSLWTLRSA